MRIPVNRKLRRQPFAFSPRYRKDSVYFVVVVPHEGNGNRIMLRADPEENHDRWSNCDFQRFYKNEYDLIENWNRILIFDYDECN